VHQYFNMLAAPTFFLTGKYVRACICYTYFQRFMAASASS
jgi:hypothetical protein